MSGAPTARPERPARHTTTIAAAAGLVLLAGVLTALTWSADPALAADAALRVVPTPVAAGSTVTVFGQGWCGSCSAVQVVLAGNTVATADPRSDGSFSVRFVVRAAPGQYQVTGNQADPSGDRAATTGLLVLPADNRTTTPTPTPTASSTPTRTHKATKTPSVTPSPTRTKGGSGSPTAPGSPPPQGVSSPPTDSGSATPSTPSSTPPPTTASSSGSPSAPQQVDNVADGSGGSGTPGWVWLLLGALAATAAGAGAHLLRRRTTGDGGGTSPGGDASV